MEVCFYGKEIWELGTNILVIFMHEHRKANQEEDMLAKQRESRFEFNSFSVVAFRLIRLEHRGI